MAVATTIAAENYLSFARVVADSFRRHHPDIPFYALLTDEVNGYFEPSAEPVHLVRLADIAIPDLHRFRFKCDRKAAVASAPGRQCLSLADYVAVTGTKDGANRGRRAVHVAFALVG